MTTAVPAIGDALRERATRLATALGALSLGGCMVFHPMPPFFPSAVTHRYALASIPPVDWVAPLKGVLACPPTDAEAPRCVVDIDNIRFSVQATDNGQVVVRAKSSLLLSDEEQLARYWALEVIKKRLRARGIIGERVDVDEAMLSPTTNPAASPSTQDGKRIQ